VAPCVDPSCFTIWFYDPAKKASITLIQLPVALIERFHHV